MVANEVVKRKNNVVRKKKPNHTKNINKNPNTIKLSEFCGKLIEYNMPKEMAEDILNEKAKGTPQERLCDYVNTQCGLLGYCIKVHVY